MSTTGKDTLSLARKWHKRQVKWRRHLHQYPEISNEEIKTTVYIRAKLKKLGVKLLPLKMKTGVLAQIDGASSSKTVAIRSDIDALPVTELTGLPFASRNRGCMHACGHDMHMATVLGAAGILAKLQPELKGNIRFLFQPAEEKPPGGARPMIAGGALKDVSTIFGIHTDPHLAVGKIALRDGPTMASVYDFDIVVHGKGGHAARPQSSVDAIVTASEVVSSLQTIVSRELNPIDAATITFGQIQGGVARNVIADQVTLVGTARTLSPQALKALPVLIRRTVAGICKARGAAYEVNEIASYPVLVNHAATNRLFARCFEELFGRKRVVEAESVLGGEDFACYLEKVPGAWMRVGVMNKKIKADQPWHSPKFVVDEESIYYGTALLVASTLEYLNGSGK